MAARDRARRIVILAADETKDRGTREWLLRDERGTWEKQARDFLKSTEIKAAELQLSEKQVDTEIAAAIKLLALEAQLKHRKRRKR